MRPRRILFLIGSAAGVAIALLLVVAAIPLSSDALRSRIVRDLSQQMNADIQLGDLDLHLFPHVRASGGALRVRRRGRSEEPLISVQHFVIEADLAGLVRKHIARVKLIGLKIVIPPRPPSPGDRQSADVDAIPTASQSNRETIRTRFQFQREVVIAELESDDAELVVMPTEEERQPRKRPAIWAIHHLRMHDVGASTAMPFEAQLTNAIPPGEIGTSGTFGPWNVDVPGDTPLRGTFSFDRADLSVFRGISGTLSSRGTFGGSLDYIDVAGQTDTPDFTVEVGGHPVSLHAAYHTVVDGTNGNTYLKRVDASFLHSSIVAAGGVYDEGEDSPGRVVLLDLSMPRARVEDVMRLAIKSSAAPMTGALTLHTRFLLPPGPQDVVDRLHLDGRFSIAGARFTNVDVQGRINELSERSRGRSASDHGPSNRVFSKFEGRFTLAGGRLALPELTFGVPGAQVQLAGAYGLRSERLDFRGTMLMDASVSQTQRGIKRLLLKAVDPLFRRKDGKDGSAIPFKIDGTRSNPQFGLDFGRVFKRGD